MHSAKLYRSGRSQEVRLQKEYRFESTEVRIRRQGSAVILEPMSSDWSWLDAVCGPVGSDFEQAALEHPGEQHRPGPEDVFK